MPCIASALVVGGSIGGLSTAIALARAGVQVDVVENATSALGTSIGFSGRAANALVDLGVYEKVRDCSTVFPADTLAITFRDSTGAIVISPGKRPTWEGYVDGVGVYRPAFIELLEEVARDLGVRVRRGVTYDTLENGEGAVTATFTDGTNGHYDLLVGADGIFSKLRERFFPDAGKPQFTGQFSIRAQSPGPPVEGASWFESPAGSFGFYNLPQGVYIACHLAMPVWKMVSDEELREMFFGLLDSMTAPTARTLRDRCARDVTLLGRPFEWHMLADPWYRGRVLLIGDAAHATSAHMGMGGGMALEDAVVLAQCITAADNLNDALSTFMARRFERVKLVVDTSVKLSEMELAGASPQETRAVAGGAFQRISQPY